MDVNVFDQIGIVEGPTLFWGRTLYWVGGTASWDATAGTKWALTSGGTGGEAIPTDADNVRFDAASGAGTVTISTGAVARDLDCTGFTGTLAGSTPMSLNGSLIYSSTMVLTYNARTTMTSTGIGNTITTSTKTILGFFTLNGIGGEWNLGSTYTSATNAGSFTLSAGTFNTRDFDILNTLSFSFSGSEVKAAYFGSSSVQFYNFIVSTSTNNTIDMGTSLLYGLGGTFSGSGTTFYDVEYDKPRSTDSSSVISGDNFYRNFSIQGTASLNGLVLISGTHTVSGTFEVTGSSAVNRIFVRSSNIGSAATISAPTTTLSNVDFRDITGTGGGSWNGTSIGDALGNSGITFTTPVTRYVVAAGSWSTTSIWSSSSGGSSGASVPLVHDTVILNGSSGSGTITANMLRLAANIDCTGFTGTLSSTNVNNGTSVYGNLTFSSGMAFVNGDDNWVFAGRGSHTITTAGKTMFSVQIVAGTYTLQDNLTLAGTLRVDIGTPVFDANDFNVTMDNLSSTSGTPTIDMGNGNWTVTGATAAWNVGTGTTITPGSSRIILQSTSTTSILFTGGGKTYNNLRFAGAHNNVNTISGANTFNTLDSTKGVAFTIQFDTLASTHTFTNWNLSGTAGNLISIRSSDNVGTPSTSAHTLVKAGGGVVDADYLNIQNSIATPGTDFYAGANSVDNQSVTTAGSGWRFIPQTPLLSVFDQLTIQEFISQDPSAEPFDSVTITESIAVARTVELSVFDQFTITEDVYTSPYLFGTEGMEAPFTFPGTFNHREDYGSATVALDTTSKVIGANSLIFSSTGTGGTKVGREFPSTYSSVFVKMSCLIPTGFAFGVSGYTGFLEGQDIDTQSFRFNIQDYGDVRLTVSGDAITYRDTLLNLPVNTVFTIQFQVIKNGSTGRVRVWLNNSNEASPDYDSGDINSGTIGINRINFGQYFTPEAVSTYYLDNFTINNSFIEPFVVNVSTSVSEAITISELQAANVENFVSVLETISNTESLSNEVAYVQSVSDNLTLTETLQLSTDSTITDSISITEDVQTSVSGYVISVSDNITLSESTASELIHLAFVGDDILALEDVARLIPLVLITQDPVTISEAIEASLVASVSVQLPENRARGSRRTINMKNSGSI